MTRAAADDEPRHGVSCIVPAYNEGPRIRAVLAALTAHPLIGEVIVVDDGSDDDTADVTSAFGGATLIRLRPNGGKSRALATGIARAEGRYLLFVDADLDGLCPADLTALIEPVLSGRAEIAISLRGNAPALWRWIGIDYISGERMMRRDLIADRLDELLRLPRFGFEIWINHLCMTKRARIVVVSWPRVESPYKPRKLGWIGGLRADARMMADLLDVASPAKLLRQIAGMARLRISRP